MEKDQNKTTTITPSVVSETTTFLDDATVENVSTSSMSEDSISVRDTGIPAFMARPQLVTTGSWTTGQASNTVVYSTSVQAALAASSVWQKKLEGFNLIRGKVCLRLQINANPFQSGRLLMHFIPCATDFINTGTSVAGLWNSNLATKTTQLGVELDARATAAVLKIPYVGPNHYHDRVAGRYDWGTVYFSVLAPLDTGAAGELSVDYSLFMWFEDFELAAPCYPQSARLPKGKSVRHKMTAVSAIEREKDVKPMTPIADALAVAGKAVGTLSAIPMLAPFTGPTSWALSVASGAASFFGWSKPELLPVPNVVVSQTNRYSATSDGVSPGNPLGMTSGNHLKITDCCSARGEDEMSFAFLKSISSMTGAFDWTTAATVGSVLYNQAISPSLLKADAFVDSSGQRFSYSSGGPIYYLSDNFTYWRGTIKVRMSFVKTIFHSGRLLITFDPIVNGSVTTFTNTLTTPMLRMVVDVREADELEFDLPFYAPSNYLLTSEWSGRLQVQVLSDLKVPETAASTLRVLTYYSGGDDFEFALPKSGLSPGPFQTQMSRMIGGDPSPPFTTEPSEQSQGEMFTSVRQLIKRNTAFNVESDFPAAGAGQAVFYWPWHTNVYSVTGSGSGYAGSWRLNGDAFDLISPLYAFYRGGINVRGLGYPGTNGAMRAIDSTTGVSSSYSGTINFSQVRAQRARGGNTTTPKTPFNGMSDVLGSASGVVWTVPYHSRTHCSLNAKPTAGQAPTTANPIPNIGGVPEFSQPSTVIIAGNAETTTINLTRSAGEDFQYSYFIGTVPRLTAIALIP